MKTAIGFRTLNLTSSHDNKICNAPKNIDTLDTVNKFIRCLMADLSNSSKLSAIRNAIETIVVAEDNMANENVNVDNVAVIIDTLECDYKSVVSLNTCYHTFDISDPNKLSYFEEMKMYGQHLKFPQYDFYKVALKAICTVGTQIRTIKSNRKMTNWEYQEQNFLELIKTVTEDLAFSLVLNGFKYEVVCDIKAGDLKVNGKKVTHLHELSESKQTIISDIYNQQFKL